VEQSPENVGEEVAAEIAAHSQAFLRSPSAKSLGPLADCLPLLNGAPAHFNELLHTILRQIFQLGGYFQRRNRERLLYETVAGHYLDAVRAWDSRFADEIPSDPEGRTIWLVLTQALGEVHAPTRRAMRLAVQARKAGFEPLIVDVASLPTTKNVNWIDDWTASAADRRAGLSTVVWTGQHLPLATLGPNRFDPSRIADVVALARDTNPVGVIQVGDFSPVGDVLAGRLPSFCVPTTFRQPVTRAQAVFERYATGPWQPLKGQSEPARITGRIEQGQPLADSGSSGADLQALDGEGFFITLPGARLDQEVLVPFERALARILATAPQVRLVLCTWYRPYRIKTADLQAFSDRIVSFHGRKDLAEIIGASDLYLAAPGLGGGTAARFAVRHGVEGVALAGGDAAAILGPEHTVGSIAELEERVLQLASGQRKRTPYPDHARAPLLDIGVALASARARFEGARSV